MKIYKIEMVETNTAIIEIEASSKSEAINIAYERYENNEFDPDDYYRSDVEVSVVSNDKEVENG